MLLCFATPLISVGEHFERIHLQIQTASAEYRLIKLFFKYLVLQPEGLEGICLLFQTLP